MLESQKIKVAKGRLPIVYQSNQSQYVCSSPLKKILNIVVYKHQKLYLYIYYKGFGIIAQLN